MSNNLPEDYPQFARMQEILVAVMEAARDSETDMVTIVSAWVPITVEACLRLQSVEATRTLFAEQIEIIATMLEAETAPRQ